MLTFPRVLVFVSCAVTVSAFATTRVSDLHSTHRSVDESEAPMKAPTEESPPVVAVHRTSGDPAKATGDPAKDTKDAQEVPTIDVRSLPTSEVAVAQPKTGNDTSTSAPLDELSEGTILERARAAMAADPHRALALTAEHVRRFSHPVLAQEREVIAIEALARLGRNDQANARAAAFFVEYPGSAYRTRVDEALGKVSANTRPTEGR